MNVLDPGPLGIVIGTSLAHNPLGVGPLCLEAMKALDQELQVHLVTVFNGQITQIRPVTPAEASAYSGATIVLNNGERSFHAMAMVERNEEEFHRHMAQSLEEYTASGLEARSLNRFHFRANWQLLNYLTSTRFFTEYTEAKAKKRFGRKSKEVHAIQSACKNAYKSQFAYRFLYELRNYAQHCGLAASSLEVNGSVQNPKPELTVYFDPAQLLREYNKWRGVEKDLREMAEPLPANPLLAQMTAELRKIQIISLQQELPELQRAGREIMDVIADALGSEAVPALCEMKTLSGDEATFCIWWPPLRMLQHLKLLGHG